MSKSDSVVCRGKTSKGGNCKRKVSLKKNSDGLCPYHTDQFVLPKASKTQKQLKDAAMKIKKEKAIPKTCAICLENVNKNVTRLHCKHEYCSDCFSNIRKLCCPQCRAPIEKNHIKKSIYKDIEEREREDERETIMEGEIATRNMVRTMALENLFQNGGEPVNLLRFLMATDFNELPENIMDLLHRDDPGDMPELIEEPEEELEEESDDLDDSDDGPPPLEEAPVTLNGYNPEPDFQEFNDCVDFCVNEIIKIISLGREFDNNAREEIHRIMHREYNYDCIFLREVEFMASSMVIN